MADEAAAAGVKVFVYSTLENVDKRSKVRICLPEGESCLAASMMLGGLPTQGHVITLRRVTLH